MKFFHDSTTHAPLSPGHRKRFDNFARFGTVCRIYLELEAFGSQLISCLFNLMNGRSLQRQTLVSFADGTEDCSQAKTKQETEKQIEFFRL